MEARDPRDINTEARIEKQVTITDDSINYIIENVHDNVRPNWDICHLWTEIKFNETYRLVKPNA